MFYRTAVFAQRPLAAGCSCLPAVQNFSQRSQANHHRARFRFGKMRRFGFDNLKNAALFDIEKNGGLIRRQHRFAAIRADDLIVRCGLANDVAAIGDSQNFNFSLDFHFSTLT